jgi:hypothetical protein
LCWSVPVFRLLRPRLPSPREVQLVKFPSRWRSKYDTNNTGVAEFKLGLGPCGLTVTKLRVRWAGTLLVITQYYSRGGSKDFIYRDRDITGRVEIEYA